jgi:hypothetical protein
MGVVLAVWRFVVDVISFWQQVCSHFSILPFLPCHFDANLKVCDGQPTNAHQEAI